MASVGDLALTNTATMTESGVSKDSKKKRRRSVRLQKRESLGVTHLELQALSIHEKDDQDNVKVPAISLDNDCGEPAHSNIVTEPLHLEHAKLASTGDFQITHDDQVSHMDMDDGGTVENDKGRKRQSSALHPIPVVSVTGPEDIGVVPSSLHAQPECPNLLLPVKLDDFNIQFENDAPSPPKQKKSVDRSNYLVSESSLKDKEMRVEDIQLPFDDEPVQLNKPAKKAAAKRSRRRSSDSFMMESNIILSPSDVPSDLPMGLPPTRRSSRIRRKSIEIFKIQQKDVVDVMAENHSEGDDVVTPVVEGSVEDESLEFTKLKIDCQPDDDDVPPPPNSVDTLANEVFEVLTTAECQLVQDVEEAPKKRAKRGRPKKTVEPDENLEEIYKNKNFVAPTQKMWETIFESPAVVGSRTQKMVGTRKYKRLIDFEDFQPQKYKQRRQKATKRGWKAATKKKRETFDKLLHNKMLELEKEVAGTSLCADATEGNEQNKIITESAVDETVSSIQEEVTSVEFDHDSCHSMDVMYDKTNVPETVDKLVRCDTVSEGVHLLKSQEFDDEEFYTPMKSLLHSFDNIHQPTEHAVIGEKCCVSENEVYETPMKVDDVSNSEGNESAERTGSSCQLSTSQFSEDDLSEAHESETECTVLEQDISGVHELMNVDGCYETNVECSPHDVAEHSLNTPEAVSDTDMRSSKQDDELKDGSVAESIITEKSNHIESNIGSSTSIGAPSGETATPTLPVSPQSVESDLSDDSFQDFGDMSFDSSKEFAGLFSEDNSKNDSGLNTALYINTPPNSRESCCSVNATNTSLNQSSVNLTNDGNSSLKLEDSFIAGSSDMLSSCR